MRQLSSRHSFRLIQQQMEDGRHRESETENSNLDSLFQVECFYFFPLMLHKRITGDLKLIPGMFNSHSRSTYSQLQAYHHLAPF